MIRFLLCAGVPLGLRLALLLVYCLNDLPIEDPSYGAFEDVAIRRFVTRGYWFRASALLEAIYFRFSVLRDPTLVGYYDYLTPRTMARRGSKALRRWPRSGISFAVTVRPCAW